MRLLSQAEGLLVDDPTARFETLLLLIDSGFNQDLIANTAWAEQAEAVAATLGDLPLRRARLWAAAVRGFTDPTFLMTDIQDDVEAAVRDFEAAGDVDAQLEAILVLNLIHLNAAHWADTLASAQRGLELATTFGRERRREDFADWMTNALCWGQTHAAEGIATIEALLPSTRRRLTRAWLLQAAGLLRAFLGDAPGAEAGQAEATAIWEELGQRPNEFRHAFARYALGDFDRALVVAQGQIDDLERRGETGMRSTMVGLQAWILTLQGRDDEADRAAGEARRLGAPDDAVTQMFSHAAAGVILARRGESEEADRISTEGVQVADTTDAVDAGMAWLARAEVLSILGRRAEAMDAARRARDLYASKGWLMGIQRAEALLDG
jgi:tetratricopeptide (TPR) repeat protein